INSSLVLGFALSLMLLIPSQAQAACTSPAGAEGDQIYNTTHKTMQFCNGTNWISMKGGAILIDKLASIGCANGQVVKFNTGIGDWQCGNDNVGDNLGNHTATTTLNMNSYAITSSAGTIRDANGGWVRTYNDTGWYNGTHGGGIYMANSTYISTFGSKSFYSPTGGTAPSIYGYNSGANYGVMGLSDGTYGVYGKTTSAAHGGVLGYTADGATYGILAHANAWSFYGNNNTYTAGYVRGDQGFRVGGTVAVNSAGAVVGGVPTCTGADKALQFNGSVWSCATVSSGGGGGAGCAAGIRTWSSCSGYVPNTPHGLTATAYSGGGCGTYSYTGSASFGCNNGTWTYTGGSCTYVYGGYCGDGDGDYDEAMKDLIFMAGGTDSIVGMIIDNRSKGLIH
ncbi:MAG TPA: hypothetical protein PLF01_04840, partial [Alphaproteobacteria bacterium]|nr:hypothetical protein [Alphaproteobacteria bacterium]